MKSPKGIRKLFLLVSILAQTFFPLVRGHFMSFSFLTAGHDLNVLKENN
jgi:hypothetical protein